MPVIRKLVAVVMADVVGYSRLIDAKRFSTHPVWIEEIRTRFILGLRKAGVPE